MFGKFGTKRTSFHNVRVDSGSYMDVDVSTTGSINNIALLNGSNNEILHRHRSTKEISSSSLFSSPFLETTWTSWNALQFIIYMIFESFLPFYWSLLSQIYDYPLTLICIQLIISIILLSIYNATRYHCCFQSHPKAIILTKYRNNIAVSNVNNDPSSNWTQFFTSNTSSNDDKHNISIRGSWIQYFFSTFWSKCRLIVFPSLFFALNIVINSVYHLSKEKDVHILFKATEIIYLIVLSPFLLTDYPSSTSVISALTITFGAICFSWNDIDVDSMRFTIISCNLLSSICKPFQILFLRRSARILTLEESETRKMDGIHLMTKSEMTLFYLLCGLCIILPFEAIFEGAVSWKYLYNNISDCNISILVIFIGCIALLCHEWNMVLLTSNVEPLIIGIAQQSEGLWRYVVAMFLGGITFHICACNNNNGNNENSVCPYWPQPIDLFDGKYLILHWFGLMAITLGLVFYCYLKAKNTHVTNVNIFKCNH